jgi:MFS family permease
MDVVTSRSDTLTDFVCFSVALSMLLVNIEVSIVGTSLISITNDLQGFSQMGWVVTGYLISYTSEQVKQRHSTKS